MSEFDPTRVDWGRTYVEALEIARRFSAREAEDLVQQGMTLVIEGKAPFDPDGGKTLAAHLVEVALAEARNRARIARLRKRRGQDAKLEQWMDEAPPTPEELSHEKRLEERTFEAVLAACAEDDDVRELAKLAREDCDEPAEQAERLGWRIERVRNARRRLARVYGEVGGIHAILEGRGRPMSERPKRTPGQASEALEKWAVREEGERVAKMSDDALDASLAEQGVDPKAARERGAALAAKLMAQRAAGAAPGQGASAEPPKVASLEVAREKKRGGGGRSVAWVTLAAAAAAVALLGGGGVIVALNSPDPTPSAPVPSAPEPHGPPEPAPTAVAQREAEDLRKLAKVDCSAEEWNDCIAKLDQANELDPAGSGARAVLRLSKEAMRGRNAQAAELKPSFTKPAPRTLDAEQRGWLVAALHEDGGGAGQHAQLACAAAEEPAHFCEQLAASMRKAGWVVARVKAPNLGADASVRRVQRIEVATDADEGTQAAADALGDALEGDGILMKGPVDVAPDPQLPSLRVTVQ